MFCCRHARQIVHRQAELLVFGAVSAVGELQDELHSSGQALGSELRAESFGRCFLLLVDNIRCAIRAGVRLPGLLEERALLDVNLLELEAGRCGKDCLRGQQARGAGGGPAKSSSTPEVVADPMEHDSECPGGRGFFTRCKYK